MLSQKTNPPAKKRSDKRYGQKVNNYYFVNIKNINPVTVSPPNPNEFPDDPYKDSFKERANNLPSIEKK